MSEPKRFNPKSVRHLARINGMYQSTVRRRLIRGMDKMDALILGDQKVKVTLAQVLDVEKLGLSITRSAYLLGISQPRLSVIIKNEKLTWRGRK